MNRKLFVWTALTFAAVLLFASCDKNALEAPKPKVEDEIKGHDEWNKIKLVMRMGKMSADNKFVEAYDESYQNVIPVKQVIEIGRAAGGTGSVQIQSALKEFQVIKGSNVYYTLEMLYYDRKGRLMNEQFCTYPAKKELQMLPIHQHFFTISDKDFSGKEAYPTTLDGKEIDEFGKSGSTRPSFQQLQKLTKTVFNYSYRDTDPVDKTIGDTYQDEKTGKSRTVDRIRKGRSLDASVPYDRVGLKGYFRFVRADIRFQMRIDLVHVLPGDKYIGRGEGGLLDFDERHPAWSVSDVILKLPFRVVADADNNIDVYVKELAKALGKDEKDVAAILKSSDIKVQKGFRI
ncbi:MULTISPECIES: hypothetical protein [Prevotellaceae]|uniref:hypothetical protein n=1 Tax=Prevotellaceae TaxID=171552 RepID=UPI0003D39E9E|nr:hypothetical protein [Prevotella phocaeensis]ETD16925.1 hypothetical protein HMPREF1199_01960 [Hoylesella oralis CC98A]